MGVQSRLAKKVTFELRPQAREGGRQEVFLAEGNTGSKAMRKSFYQKNKAQKEASMLR